MQIESRFFAGAKLVNAAAAFVKVILITAVVSALAAAQPERRTAEEIAAASREVRAESAKLKRLASDYWENFLADDPAYATYLGDSRYDAKLSDISEKAYQMRYQKARAFLIRANEIRAERLSKQERISLKMLRQTLSLIIEGEPLYAYLGENYLVPINQLEGFHVRLLTLPEDHPFRSTRDYRNYLARLRAFPSLVDAAIENMRKGMRLGIVLPKAVVERVIPQLQSGVTPDAKKSLLYAPAKRFPPSVSAADKQRITADLEREISTTVSNGFGKLAEFMKTEYLPKARPTFAFSELPNGRAMYAYAVKVRTTTAISADEFHEQALKELERAALERQKIITESGFKGTAKEFLRQMQENRELRWFDAAAVERDLRENLKFMESRLPQLFLDLPPDKYELKPVEPFRAPSFPNGAYYGPSPDGKRAGIFYYNTYNIETEGVRKFVMPNMAFHEVLPGHHWSVIYGRINREIPAFRRFGGNVAYSEGWATYAEKLADEVGAYRDIYARIFWLNAQIANNAFIVADTGIHAKGWTREQALAFIQKYLQMPEARFEMNLARWSVLPGYSIGYSAGAQWILQLRERAKKELGNGFDIREFHRVVLSSGYVPLDILTELVDEWIAAKKSSSQK